MESEAAVMEVLNSITEGTAERFLEHGVVGATIWVLFLLVFYLLWKSAKERTAWYASMERMQGEHRASMERVAREYRDSVEKLQAEFQETLRESAEVLRDAIHQIAAYKNFMTEVQGAAY